MRVNVFGFSYEFIKKILKKEHKSLSTAHVNSIIRLLLLYFTFYFLICNPHPKILILHVFKSVHVLPRALRI